jgi:hypothetical protein
MASGIYEIWIGDYYYHGMSKNIEKRIKQHKCLLKHNRHENKNMQNVWNKYKTFEYQILVECKENLLELYEKDYIDANFGLPKYLNIMATNYKRQRNKNIHHVKHTSNEKITFEDLKKLFPKVFSIRYADEEDEE